MGDRVSIAFENGKRTSVTLFNHWGGLEFVDHALSYIKILKEELGSGSVTPLQRLEPSTVIVDFIRSLTHEMEIVDKTLYLCRDKNDGDNGNNGHWVIDVNEEIAISETGNRRTIKNEER